MLRLTPADQRYALDKATEASEAARLAKNDDDRQFWADMEARWHGVAETSAFIERLNIFNRQPPQLAPHSSSLYSNEN